MSLLCARCGLPKEKSEQKSYCRQCHNLKAREYRAASGGRSALPLDERLRNNCRSYTKVCQKRGQLPKGPCFLCGSQEAQNHHLDYRAPHLVVRLCQQCHRLVHQGKLSLL